MRYLTMLGVLLAVLAAIFTLASLAGNAQALLVIGAVVCVGVGVLTNT